jgi:membrane-bound lytic murein transglycosylase D
LEINRLNKKSRLSAGTNLLIPLPKDQDLKADSLLRKKSRGADQGAKPVETTYAIKKGDSLWSIANEMGVNIGALSRWNNLHPDKKLMPGDKLKIKIGETHSAEGARGKQKGKEIIYVVKEGDTLWSIAKKFNLTVSEIKTWNHIGEGNQIHPEDRLRLRVGGTKSSTLN